MENRRQKWLQFGWGVLKILGAATGVAVLVSLGLRSTRQVSNVYFISMSICWVIAAIPALREIGGNTRITLKNLGQGEKARQLIHAREEAYRAGARRMYMFGVGGMLCFILAVLTLPL